MPGHLVVLLMDVAVEHRHIAVRHEQLDRFGAVACGPVPLRGQIEQRAVREDDDAGIFGLLLQVLGQPGQLHRAQAGAGIADVVEHDAVHALVFKGVVGGAEELLEGLAVVQRSVVLARNETHVLDLQFRNDGLDLRHALAALFGVIRGVGQVAREDDEIGGLRQRIDGSDGFGQRALGIRVGCALKAPMQIRQLDKIKVLIGDASHRVGGKSRVAQARHVDGATDAREVHKLSAIKSAHN